MKVLVPRLQSPKILKDTVLIYQIVHPLTSYHTRQNAYGLIGISGLVISVLCTCPLMLESDIKDRK